MIEKCKNSNSYEVTDLSVENYNGHMHLGSTNGTTIKEISMHVLNIVENPKGPQLVSNIHKTATKQELIFTDSKVSVFMTCYINNCKKEIPYVIESPVFTCPSCGSCQKVKGAKKGATAQLCAAIEDKKVWLTAFTDVMENLLAKVHLSIHGTSDQIKKALLTMENITLVIDYVSNFILGTSPYKGLTRTRPLSCGFDSSVGRALHRRRRGRGFESRSEPEFFQVSVLIVLRPHLHYDRYHSIATMGQITFIKYCVDLFSVAYIRILFIQSKQRRLLWLVRNNTL